MLKKMMMFALGMSISLVGVVQSVDETDPQGYCAADSVLKVENSTQWQEGRDVRKAIVSHHNLLFGKDKIMGEQLDQGDLDKWNHVLEQITAYVQNYNKMPVRSKAITGVVNACLSANDDIVYCIGYFMYQKDSKMCLEILSKTKKSLELAMAKMCAENYFAESKRILRGVVYHFSMAMLSTIEKLEKELR